MQKNKIIIFFSLVFSIGFFGQVGMSQAETINAASCAQIDVQSAIGVAQEGDTVFIPAGSCSWTGGITWSPPSDVTFKGAGTTETGGGDQTIITDDYVSGNPLLSVTVPSSGVFRLTGITFRSGGGSVKDGGTIRIRGTGSSRLDHLHLDFTSHNNYKIINWDGPTGVIDHSIIYLQGANAIYTFNSGSTGAGDDVWAQETGFGSSSFLFIEDNVINGSPETHDSRIVDGFWGAKTVIRFNTVTAACGYEVHATGSWVNGRGARATELYGNFFQKDPEQSIPNRDIADMSSGPALVWGNNADLVFKQPYISHIVRADNATYSQSATPNGWGYAGTNFNGTGSMWDGGTALGTDFVYGYPAIDQPGRGVGDQLTGSHPNKLNTYNNQIYWPRQALEPMYIWMNTDEPVPGWGGIKYSMDANRVVADRDYYPRASGVQTSPTSPFDGNTGTGWGTLSNRPTTCTTGVGYFVTDQGSWNTSLSNPYGVQQNGADGILYKCTDINTWTAYYTPYTYPHPLSSGDAGDTTPPAVPVQLQVQ